MNLEDAITSWFNKVYLPIASIINRKHILRSVPGRTVGDLYVWIVRYWDDLKQKFGNDVSLDTAVT